MMDRMELVRGQLTGDAALDTAVSRSILQRVGAGELPETLQIGTPHRVVAFGKHDAISSGFDAAVGAARRHGHDVTVRIAGGRAVAFSPTIVRFAWTIPAHNPAATMHARFSDLAQTVVRTLHRLGVDAAVGEIPGEYCAGEYSVHVLGSRKVMGVGQRLSRSAAQVGGMIVVADPDGINRVLLPVYEALDVPMDPLATGSIADVATVDPDDVMDAFAHELADGRSLVEVRLGDATLDIAASLRPRHAVAMA